MKLKIVFIMAVLTSFLIFGGFVELAEAADEDLVQQYAPILYFEKDETCFPVDVSYHIENSYLYQLENTVPIDTGPTFLQALPRYHAFVFSSSPRGGAWGTSSSKVRAHSPRISRAFVGR